MKLEQETITVNRVYSEVKKRKSQEVFNDEDTKVEVRTFSNVPTASVSFRAGLTKNLGSYNSATVQVCVTVPTYLEEIDDAVEFAAAKVDEYLAPGLNEFVGILKEKGLLKDA